MSDPVLLTIDGHVATITLNRPENRNMMNAETLPAFEKVVDRVKADSDLRCVVITGSGKAFCAGADFKAAAPSRDMPAHEMCHAVYRPFLAVADLAVPTIAAVNGHAIGGGFGLALVCDMRVVASEAKIGANFARLGLSSGMAISYLLPRLVGLSKAAEMLFTGRLLTGDQAHALGLANHVTPADQVLPTALDLAGEIAASAPVAVRLMKKALYANLAWNPGPAAHTEALAQAHTLKTDDATEGIAALLEKRTPVFKGK